MNILVIGGMHGNEPLGQDVVAGFRKKPVKNVDAIFANQEAIDRNQRFVTQDLNRSFPGRLDSEEYETRRAAELLRLAKYYNVILDFHNTHCPDNDCGFVGETAPQKLYDVASWLGLKRVIAADYDCVNKYSSNCLSIEISLSSGAMDAQLWRERINELAQQTRLKKAEDLKIFRFVYRMTLDDKMRLGLPKKNLRAFQPIDENLAAEMGVASPAYPIFVNDAYTPYNYGGLLNPARRGRGKLR